MQDRIPQSTSYLLIFKAYLSTDHVTEATSKTIAITISKNGGAFGNPAAGATNATEISSGWYKVTLGTGDTDTLGPLAVRGAVATVDDVGVALSVVNANTGGYGFLDIAVSSRLATSGYTAPSNLTAAQIATGIWQDVTAGDFTVASSIGKSLYTTGNVPGAASGIALVGSNVGTATSVSGSVGSVTGNVGGNVTGSVGSVVGAVGSVTGSVASVTGAVGSVTGNVGGNVTGSVGSVVGAVGSVTGSVASVTGAVGSVTGNVGGNVTGSVGSVVGLVAANLDATVSSRSTYSGGAVASVTGSVASVTGNVGGNVVGSVGSVTGLTASNLDATVSSRLAAISYTAPDNTSITAIKTQTDNLAFTVANQVDSNIRYVNGVLVTGTGASGDEWGP